jgi:hypothetical protein
MRSQLVPLYELGDKVNRTQPQIYQSMLHCLSMAVSLEYRLDRRLLTNVNNIDYVSQLTGRRVLVYDAETKIVKIHNDQGYGYIVLYIQQEKYPENDYWLVTVDENGEQITTFSQYHPLIEKLLP